jgi:hypothetical protein
MLGGGDGCLSYCKITYHCSDSVNGKNSWHIFPLSPRPPKPVMMIGGRGIYRSEIVMHVHIYCVHLVLYEIQQGTKYWLISIHASTNNSEIAILHL